MNRKELLYLLPKEAIVAEIGVEAGIYSKQIFNITNPKELHLIDCWRHQFDEEYEKYSINPPQETMEAFYAEVKDIFKLEIENGRVLIHKGYSDEVLSGMPDNYYDWVYIDANHLFKAVLKDLELCRLKVKAGGLICGHDYLFPDDPIAKSSGMGNCGVRQAVGKFCEKWKWEIIYLTNEVKPSYVLACSKKTIKNLKANIYTHLYISQKRKLKKEQFLTEY